MRLIDFSGTLILGKQITQFVSRKSEGPLGVKLLAIFLISSSAMVNVKCFYSFSDMARDNFPPK